MFPFIIIPIGVLIFRLLGAAGVRRFSTLPASAAHAMAIMLVITASAHFVPAGVSAMPNHGDLVAMMPPFVPFPSLMVYATGVLELLGALGLVMTPTRRLSGIALAIFFVLVLPANIYAAVADIPFAGEEATPLWLRVPEQLVYIAVALWAARSADVRADGKSGLTERGAPKH
ncbi:hypothetical protein ACIBI9_60770 [Nonomuraea sp. NPDC050451]|uniref:hypothetical protein n=1 Tax=Nonomuraea sp. NPDC050451 TaxID=3364364 RepID=UPI003799C5C1